MKRIAYKMVWMVSVLVMLLINNSVLFAQSTEETIITQDNQDLVDDSNTLQSQRSKRIGSSSINGIVINGDHTELINNSVLSGVKVIIKGEGKKGRGKRYKTGTSGFFKFNNLSSGDYKIKCEKEGCETYEEDITLLDDDALSLNIVMYTENGYGIKSAATTVTPSISSFRGRTWPQPTTFNCYDKSQKGYFQVAYSGYPSIYLYANGNNLDKITSVEMTEPLYNRTVKIIRKSSSQLSLEIRATYDSSAYDSNFHVYYPKPISKPTINFYYDNGNNYISKQIEPGIIPTFYQDNQVWGQCTWYAGIIMRKQNNQSEVISYSTTISINGNPNSSGFPKAGSVLNDSGKRHMAYLEKNNETSRITNSDGSETITYSLTGSHYNGDPPCQCSYATFSTTMVVKKSKDGKSYTITQYPKVVYDMTKVKQ